MVSRLIFLLSVWTVVSQFPVNDTGVPLPSGCKQVLWYRGSGTQDYVCSDPTNLGKLTWTLVEPHAILQVYSGNLVSTPIPGYHYFTKPGIDGQAGSGPGWSLGSECGFYNCTTITDQFLGSVNTSAPQPGTIPWLLVSKVSSYGPEFQNIQYVQRLNTVGGVAPLDCQYLGQTFNAPYQADYLFATCSSSLEPQSTTHPQFDPNNPHSKYEAAFLKRFYSTTPPTTTTPPTSTTSMFNPNNPHSRYQEEFSRKSHNFQKTSTPTATQTPAPTSTFDSNNPHSKYIKEFYHKFKHAFTSTPSPTDTPNIDTYESYTQYRQIYHPTHNTPPTNVPSQSHFEGEKVDHVPEPSHEQAFNFFMKSRQHSTLEQQIPQQKLSTDPTPVPMDDNYNPHEMHKNIPRTRHYNSISSNEAVTEIWEDRTQFTTDPTPVPVEINYNPHQTHSYRPRTRHYEKSQEIDSTDANQQFFPVEAVESVNANQEILPILDIDSANPIIEMPEVNLPPSDFGVGINYVVKQSNVVSTTPSPTPVQIDYNPHEYHQYEPRIRKYAMK